MAVHEHLHQDLTTKLGDQANGFGTNGNNLQTKRLSAAEIEALSDHLIARSVSRLTDDQPHLRQRLLLAAALLRVMVAEHPEGVSVEVFVQRRRLICWRSPTSNHLKKGRASSGQMLRFTRAAAAELQVSWLRHRSGWKPHATLPRLVH